MIGCGPVGLAVISHLKASGGKTIIASDFSSGRRTLATRCGADVVATAFDAVGESGAHAKTLVDPASAAVAP